jgi:hypothetical protein
MNSEIEIEGVVGVLGFHHQSCRSEADETAASTTRILYPPHVREELTGEVIVVVLAVVI